MSIQDDNHAVRRGLRVWPGVQLMSQAMVVALPSELSRSLSLLLLPSSS